MLAQRKDPMSPYQDALLGYFWIWALCHLLGLFVGFIVLETPYGTSTLRQKLVRSLRAAGALYALLGLASFTWGNQNPWDTHLAAMGTLIAVHILTLYIAGDFRGSTLD